MPVSVVVGNPNTEGRTTRVAETTARYAIMDEFDAIVSKFMATAGPILARVFGR